MNLTSGLDVVNLTTLERVRDAIDYGVDVDGGPDADAYIERLIESVSRSFTIYLGFHTLEAARVETYEFQVPRKHLTLNARPIDMGETFEVRFGTDPQDAVLDALTAEDGENFRVSAPGGWLRVLRTSTMVDSTLMRYARVTYTGGMATTPAAFVAAYPDIAGAADTQIKYTLQRGDSLGGSISLGDAVSVRTGEFGMLRTVRELLDGYRRHSL